MASVVGGRRRGGGGCRGGIGKFRQGAANQGAEIAGAILKQARAAGNLAQADAEFAGDLALGFALQQAAQEPPAFDQFLNLLGGQEPLQQAVESFRRLGQAEEMTQFVAATVFHKQASFRSVTSKQDYALA